MPLRARSFWIATAATLYVAIAAIRTGEDRTLAWAMALGLPFVLAIGWALLAPPPRGEDRIDETARSAARTCLTGAAIVLAARSGPTTAGFLALENLGAALACTASLVGLARIGSLGGLIQTAPSARRLDAAAFGSLLWTVAIGLPAARALDEVRTSALDPLLSDYATVAASVASLGLAAFTTLRMRTTRRLELGVRDRATAALFLTLTALGIGVGAGLVGVAKPERVLPLTAMVASCAIAASAVTPEATSLSRALRIVLAMAVPSTPVALLAAYVAHAAPSRSGPAVLVACAATAVAGLASPLLSRRFAPEGARWLRALDAATNAAMTPDPDAALESALLALRSAAGRGASDPALYQIALPEVVTVDRAGYAHHEHARAPERLLELAEGEPESILRIEVVRAAQVRHPEVRDIVDWLVQRAYGAVAVVRDDTSAIGLLAIPAGVRRSPMTLEEVRALRALSDRLGAVIGVSALLSRSRARELEVRVDLDKSRAEAKELAVAAARDASRVLSVAKMLARPAQVAAYSPAAQSATLLLERLGAESRPIALLSAPGVDVVAWAAVAHLASPRRGGPLTLVDGMNRDEHAIEHWRDPAASPLRAGAGGSLVLIDVHALPHGVQSYIAAALPEGTGVIVSAPATVDTLVATGRMSDRLADMLGDHAVALPTLASRGEDIRALTIEHLSRIGVRFKEHPLGLEPQALVALLDHTWPGNDAELYATLLRAALMAEGDVVTAKDLERIGFYSVAAEGGLELRRVSSIPAPRRTRKGRV